MGLKKYCLISGLIFFIFFTINISFAFWTEPSEIISATWGSGINQFKYEPGDTVAYDVYPSWFKLSDNGLISIYDEGNDRVVLYDNSGNFLRAVIPTGINPKDWALRSYFVNNSLILFHFDNKYQVYDINGVLHNEFLGVGQVDEINVNQSNIYVKDNESKKYYKYSSTGTLLQTYTIRPLELGFWEEKLLNKNPNQYRVTVKFADSNYPGGITQWVIVGKGSFPNYQRDRNGNLYAVGEKQVARYDSKGREIARFTVPKNKYGAPEIVGVEKLSTLDTEYGSPILDLDGNIYCWARTPTNYKILKWTWQNN